MNHLKFLLAASIAALLTLSCSNEEGNEDPSSSSGAEISSSSNNSNPSDPNPNGNSSTGISSSSSNAGSSSSSSSGSSSSINQSNNSDGSYSYTKDYALVSKTNNEFTYTIVYKDEYCKDGGILEIRDDPWDNTINYSIADKIMTWQEDGDTDTLNFKGTSNELIGTWTRTRDKAASCLYDSYYEDYYCKSHYDITKAIFTESTVSITRSICFTDKLDGDEIQSGWRWRTIDCNTAEIYKGSDKISFKITIINEDDYSYTYSYKGESCEYNPSKLKKEAACKETWDTYHVIDEYNWRNNYYDILEKEFNDCMNSKMPPELTDDSHEDAAAKPLAKAKFKIRP